MMPRHAGSTGRALTMAFALLGVMGLPARSQAQLSLSELEVRLRPDVVGQRTGVVRITNDSDKPVQAMIDVQDWNRDAAGNNQFAKLGSLAGSCKEQLKVFPLSLRIEAHAAEPLRISFDGPATSACWGIVFVQAAEPPQPSGKHSQITYVIRTGIKVYVEPEGAARVGDVDSVALVQTNASPTDSTKVPAIEVRFRNSGVAHLKPTGAIEIRSADNQVAAKLEIAEFPIAPGDTRRLLMPLPKLNAGRYVALVILDYQGPEIAAGQLEFEVP